VVHWNLPRTSRTSSTARTTRTTPTAGRHTYRVLRQSEKRSSCLQQFQSGVFYFVTRIRDPRFVAVDPERGLAFAFFDNASRNGTLADGRNVVSGPSVPWTWQIAEVFKIERGKIGPVESVLHQVPYGMGSGWSTWEDAMSSRPRSF
jgi:hypothetical protein